jgi:hypothetical protein
MLPFHTFFGGDHCPILIDFNAKTLFGDESYEIQRAKSRGVKLEDPRIVDKFLDLLQKQLIYHKIYDKNEELKEKSEMGEWTTKTVQQYEIMDKIITESVRYADRSVGKRYSTKYEWSPEILRSVNELRYWTLRLKQTKGIWVDAENLKTL